MARNTKHDCPHCGCDTRPMRLRILSSKMNAFFCQQECYQHYRKRREAIDPMMESLIEKAKEGIKVIGIFHQTDADDFEVIEFFSANGDVKKGDVLGRGKTLHAARKFVPKGMIQISNNPKDDHEPKLVEAWIHRVEGTA